MTIGMNLISWIVVGLIAGFLAGKVMRTGGYGLIGDIIVGVLGALIGRLPGHQTLQYQTSCDGDQP